MQEEMDVGVDKAGKQVTSPRSMILLPGMGDRCTDGADVVAFYQDFAGLEDDAGFDLEQAGGVEDDGAGRPAGRGRWLRQEC